MPSNPETSGGGQEEKGSGAKRSKEKPIFDKQTLQALLKLHSENLDEEQSVKESIAKVLSLSDKEITRAITSAVRAVREDVQYLLECMEQGKATKGFSLDTDAVRQRLNQEDVPVSLSELSQWKGALSEELSSRGKDPNEMLEKKFAERTTDKKFQQDQRVLSQVEIAFLLDAIGRNRAGKVQDALTEMPESKDPQEMLLEVRKRLYELLLPQQKGFNAMEKLDVLRKEIHDSKEEQEYQELSGRILEAFGRKKEQAAFHTVMSLEKALKVYGGRVERTLGRMNQEGKIAFMVDENGQTLYLCREKKLMKYSSKELVAALNSTYFDQIGAFLREALDRGDIVDRNYLQDHAHELTLPADVAVWLLDCYVDLGKLKRGKDRGYHMPEGEEKAVLSSTVFARMDLAQQFYELAVALNDEELDAVSEEVDMNWKTLEDDYRKFREKRAVKKVSLETKNTSMKVLHFTEIQFGHKDLDEKALQQFLEQLKNLPEGEKPNVIVVSGLLFGRFKHWEKDKHRLKVWDMDKQLRAAKMFLDQVRELGIQVIYNTSDNDALIVKEYTYDAVKIMSDILSGAKFMPRNMTKKHLARGATYYQFEQQQSSKAWPQHFAFQWEVVFEYMLRSGRHLLSAEEVLAQHGEYMEEYLLLLYAYKNLKDGKLLEELAKDGDKLAELALKVLEIGHISLPGKKPEDNLIVTSNFDMSVKTKGKEFAWEEKHFFRQSPTSKVQDPLKEAREDIGQRHAMGEDTPRVFAVEGEGHSVGSLEGEKTLVFSTPGLHRVRDGDSSYTHVLSDENKRRHLTRRERFTPGVTPVTLLDDGRIQVDFWNEHFLEKAEKSKERSAVVLFSDWQTGSVTARPDLAVKALDYVFHDLLDKGHPVYLFFNGDIIQGRNYPEMPNENTDIGLVKIGHQVDFVYSVLEKVLSKVPREHKKKIRLVSITPGNHEWNSRHKDTGASHSDYLRDIFHNFSENTYPVKLHDYDAIVTYGGDRFKSFSAIEDIEKHKVLVQHIGLERGGKGGGGPPIYQARELIRGIGPHMKNIDVIGTGHYHHPSYIMTNDKLAVINGSIAGISGYEWWRGYNPVIGTTILWLGGGQPPKLEILTRETLHKHEAKGYYSDKNLAEEGFSTDQGFDPEKHGFGRVRVQDGARSKRLPQSAVQHALWDEVRNIQEGMGDRGGSLQD